MPRSETVGVKVTPEMKTELQKVAEADQRPLSSMVVMILRDYLNKNTVTPARTMLRKAAK